MPQYGMNIDPNNGSGRPDPSTLKGLRWIRMVFNAEPRLNDTFEQLCAFYGGIIDAYNQIDIRTLLILNHQISVQFRPPSQQDGEYAKKFEKYAALFSDRCGEIAQVFKGKNAAYEVWNEQDQGSDSALGIPSAQYKLLLTETNRKIKVADSNATVVIGGLVSGDPIGYLTPCLDAQGRLAADAIGLHPYTKFYAPAGLGSDLKRISRTFSGMPLWLTEFHDGGLKADIFERAKEALIDFDAELPSVVKTAMWYCWSDGMNPGFGIVDGSGGKKDPVYKTYFELAAGGSVSLQPDISPDVTIPPVTPVVGTWKLIKLPQNFVNIRDFPAVSGRDLGDLKFGEEVTLFEPEVNGWVFVKRPNVSGWVSLQRGAVAFGKVKR